jgi:hypothetical protein
MSASTLVRGLRGPARGLWHSPAKSAALTAVPVGRQAQRRSMSDTPGVSSVSSVGFRLSRSGRFSGETDPLMEQFNASIGYDKRMWRQDSEFTIIYYPIATRG